MRPLLFSSSSSCQIKLFCMHPVKNMMMMENKLEVHKDKTLREATEIAYKVRFSLWPWGHHCNIIPLYSYLCIRLSLWGW